jgi:hypothetical protein
MKVAALALVAACSSHPPGHVTTASSADETLAFEIDDGAIKNYFFRHGPVAAHVLVTAGAEPRVIVAFPAGNTGVGVWFAKTGAPVKFAIDGDVTGVERGDGMRGVAAVLASDADRLEVRGAVLGSIRTLRDYAILGKKPAETEHQISAGPPVVLRRTTADGKHHVELVLEPQTGTTITADGGKVVIAGKGGVRVRATALADDPPLTPIPASALLSSPIAGGERDLRALAFLSYKEKLLAGSWRFLTYFGRDTLLSVRLLEPVLAPDVIEAALGAVLERLASDGDVAHEEDIGDFAAMENAKKTPRPGDLDQPNYDYKMVDDDFMLAPILASYLLDSESGRARAAQFLARKTSAGQPFTAALEKNLQLVIARATPFAEHPSATTLVAIKPGIPVGQWRDSEQGLGGGRYAFDVNVALVPAALDAAARLYESPLLGSNTAAAANARKLWKAWQGAEAMFRVDVPADVAAARIKDYAAEQGIDPAEALESLAAAKGPLRFDAISLDAAGKPVPIMHSDDGFVLLFTNPSPEFLEQAAGRILRPFPAGLRTPVGIVVANPAFAPDKALRDTFTRGHYHGTVVWSWQQALLGAGIARQLERTDLKPSTLAALMRAQHELWDAIDATASHRSGELWTWDVKDKKIVIAPFGQSRGDADEANAIQLWSTVYLGVHRPSAH